MAHQYGVLLMTDEYNYTVKKVDQPTYDLIRKMKAKGEDDIYITKNLVQLSIRRENTLGIGLHKEEAIEKALESADDYVILRNY